MQIKIRQALTISVSKFQNPKKISVVFIPVLLFYLVLMSSFTTLDMPLLAEFFTFKQRERKFLKMLGIEFQIYIKRFNPCLLCVFYWDAFTMDYLMHVVITGGNFLEIDELESLRIIKGLVVFSHQWEN